MWAEQPGRYTKWIQHRELVCSWKKYMSTWKQWLESLKFYIICGQLNAHNYRWLSTCFGGLWHFPEKAAWISSRWRHDKLCQNWYTSSAQIVGNHGAQIAYWKLWKDKTWIGSARMISKTVANLSKTKGYRGHSSYCNQVKLDSIHAHIHKHKQTTHTDTHT